MTTDEERFTLLYERYYPQLEKYVRRRIDDALVADVLAEVFLVAWRRWREVPKEPLPWLYGVARRVLANEFRRVERARALTVRAASQPFADVTDHADEVNGLLSLQAAWEQLAEGDREIVALIAWEQLTLRQAAQVLECSVPAAAMRVHRARRRLRDALRTSPDQGPASRAVAGIDAPTGGHQ